MDTTVRSRYSSDARVSENMTQSMEGNHKNKVSDSELKPGTKDKDCSFEDREDGTRPLCCAPETSPGKVVARIGACAVAGLIFGLALEKGRVFEPAVIRGQMVLEKWIMLKMFLAAMGTGQLCLAFISVLPPTREMFQRAFDAYGGTFTDKGLLTSLLGPFILGVGMTLSGACPGMVLAQVGSWTKNAIFTFIGALVGAFLYGLVAPTVVQLTRPKKMFKKQTVHEYFGIPYMLAGAVCGGLIMTSVVLLEVFVPWQEDLDPVNRNSNNTNNIFELRSWPPSISGCLIGAMQLVIVFAVGDTLGGSSSYMTLVSQWVITDKLKKIFPYMAKFRCGIGNWWQVVYVGSAMIGATFSSVLSDSLATAKGVNIPCALSGGALLLLGARFASGCTSGHGLSGAGLLFWLSLVAVPAMFAGGISTAFAMKATGALSDFVCYEQPCH